MSPFPRSASVPAPGGTLRLALGAVLAAVPLWASAGARADGPPAPPPPGRQGQAEPSRPSPAPPAPPAPPTVLHVPADELDVLLKAQGRAVVLGYAEYLALLEAARAKAASEQALPPLDAVRLSAEGALDLTPEAAATLKVVYRVQGLAPGPRSVGFASGGVALERVAVEPEAGAGPARYEERDGVGRLALEGPGVRRVTIEGSAVPARRGAERLLELWLPNPAAMSLDVTVPAGMEATLAGEGQPQRVRAPAGAPLVVRTRPTRGGQLKVAWSPAVRVTDGPSVLDAEVKTLYTVGDGIVDVQALATVDVLRTAADALVLDLPEDLAVHAVEGAGVTGHGRSEDRRRLTVRLEKPVLGTVKLLLRAERPLAPSAAVALPRVTVAGALRHRGEVALRFGADVNARAVAVSGGRRVSAGGGEAAAQGVLRYSLVGADAGLSVDLEPGRLRFDATSTYYLNLAEPGRTLLATVTYRVLEGTLHRLTPTFPPAFDLRELTLNGQATGFSRDRTPDGAVELTLEKGVPTGGELLLLATLERAEADWVPEAGRTGLTFAVPAAGATREEGYLAVGADAGFEVLETSAKDLRAVGAADLTARGLSAAGLVYGYRLDGGAPALGLEVARRAPLVDAEVLTTLHPGARRLDVSTLALFRVQRAGVRRLFLDLPEAAGDRVDVQAPGLRAATRLSGERRPADVPPGYARWQIDLEQRVLGTAPVRASWFLDQTQDDWSLSASQALAGRVPVERAVRTLVVRRSEGLEVRLPSSASTPEIRALDLTELPAEALATLDPLSVLEAVRLPAARDGIELSVRKHGGAAVLDAIATEVRLATAVATEGILRTRATVELFNVDRQFLEVVLPPASLLVGAVVDGTPVKPLVDPSHALLITVPTTRARGAGAPARTRVALTYETRLAGPVSGRLSVAGPVFPGLEVLRTTHQVAVEPDLLIASAGGDFLTSGRVSPPARDPWLLRALAGLSPSERVSAAASSGPATPGASAPPPPTAVLTSPAADGASTSPRLERESGMRVPGGAVPPGRREPSDPSPPPPAPPEQAPAQDPAPGHDAPKTEDHNETDADQPFDESLGESSALNDAEGRAAAPAKPGQGAGRGRPRAPGGPAGPGEGGEPDGAAGPGRPGRSRKGQLSLDVPVRLAPSSIVASRLGSGGSLELELVRREGREQGYQALLLVALGAGLLAAGRRWLPGWLVVLAGFLAALVLHLTLGAEAGAIPAALADAATALGGLLLLRGLALKAFGPRAAPRGRSGPASAAAALLLGAALAVAGASPARADEEPDPAAAPEAAPGAVGDGTVIAPLDPDRGAVLSDGDRVFVPLSTWLALQRRAYPERDPELVALGQVVTLVEASYRVDVGGTNGEGTARFVLSQRGRGLMLVALPLPGLALTEARLDGRPVRLLLDGAAYRLPLEALGDGGRQDRVLEVSFQVPVAGGPGGRTFAFGGPTFAAATLDVTAGDFGGTLEVSGAGRVAVLASPASGEEFHARAWLGRAVKAGAASSYTVRLAERSPASLPAEVRTRVESRCVHSLRDGGTETVLSAQVHVLQGRAPFVDFTLPAGVEVLEASGPQVARWEASPGRVRLVLAAPQEGVVAVTVRAFRPADAPERAEELPELAALGATGESGLVIVNGDPTLRLTLEAGPGLFRTGRPAEPDAVGADRVGRVAGAWRFAARPAPLSVRAQRAGVRLSSVTRVRVTVGDDRVRTLLEGVVEAQRAAVGELTFRLPGPDEIRSVEGPGLLTWWTSGEGEQRRLHVRFTDLAEGARELTARLERRLGGQRDGLSLPRWRLEGAQDDRGLLVVFTLPDVEPQMGSLAGLRALPPSRLAGQQPNVEGARATHAFEWEAAVDGALPAVLRTPEQELEAVVVSQISPGDELQRLEHLVLFDVRRGAADTLRLFLPDGGAAADDVVRARDLRELRSERVTRTDADGREVNGLLYTIRLQSPRSGLVEVTAGQTWPPGTVVRMPRPEGVKATRWFGLVRTFLDGSVEVRPGAGEPDPAEVADLPFLPTGLPPAAVLKAYAARAPWTLQVLARRHRLEQQADALVLSAQAEAVVGLDGEARVRVRYRLFNRSRQHLSVRLPAGAVLYGAVAAGQPVKPLAGPDGSVLLPVPKVPLGGTGYEVALTYRARAAGALHGGGAGSLPLPEVPGVAVDRTLVRLTLPAGYGYDFETKMNVADEREVEGDRVEAALREAREVLKVAQQGTLEQRIFACENSAPLVESAKTLLLRYKEHGSVTRAAALEAELNKVAEVADQARVVCRVDAGTWQNEQTLQANLAAAETANGQTLVVLSEPAGDRGGDGAAAPQTANWRFNPTAAGQESAAKKDLLDLKERLQTELERRDADERRKTVDVVEEEKSRAAQPRSKNPAQNRQTANDDATLRFDENRNNALVNDRLRQVQLAQRQQGIEQWFGTYQAQQEAAEPQQAGNPLFVAGSGGGGAGGRLRDLLNAPQRLPAGDPAGGAPDAGVFYADGQDGDFAGRTENDYRRAGEAPAQTRRGLMGVDVPLPRDGRTFWFSTPSGGTPLAFEASPEGTPSWLRALLATVLLALLGVGLLRLARRPLRAQAPGA